MSKDEDLPNPIDVIIYSYKGKYLKEVVDNLIQKSSKKNKIYIHVLDQSTLTKQDHFDKIFDLTYNHIFWDKIKGPCYYKNNILKESKFSYTLFLSDNIFLSENWDEYLLNNLTNKYSIISGKNITTLQNDGPFYISKKEIISDQKNKTYFVNRDLIFGHTETLQQIGYPWYMKYYGEEEILSVLCFTNNIKIDSCPNYFYQKRGSDTIKELYTTFSKYHNYNEMIYLFKNKKNKYIDIDQPLIPDISFFFKMHDIDPNLLNPLPFSLNDVEYDPDVSNFDDIDSKKFMTKINYID